MKPLAQALDDYLYMRRGLGFKLQDTGCSLRDFVRYLDDHGASYITTQLAIRWATLPSNVRPSHWARRLTMVRLFAIHRKAEDPRTEIPPAGAIPGRNERARPYLYSDDEIYRLIDAARSLRTTTGLRPQTYATLFGLLSVTGMRIGEIIALDRGDVDLEQGVLTIRRAKFGKTRLIPVHAARSSTLRRPTRPCLSDSFHTEFLSRGARHSPDLVDRALDFRPAVETDRTAEAHG